MIPIDEATVWSALREIKDPEFDIDLVALGLIYAVVCTDTRVGVTMTLTTPHCPSGEWIHEGVKAKLTALPGVAEVSVDLVFTPPWTPARLSMEARRQLGC